MTGLPWPYCLRMDIVLQRAITLAATSKRKADSCFQCEFSVQSLRMEQYNNIRMSRKLPSDAHRAEYKGLNQ